MDRCIFGNFLLSWINKCYEKTHPQGQTHTGDVNNYYYNVGAAVSDRTLRLYSSAVTIGNLHGGIVYVEYL
jgi:hypothetical protein